MAVEGFNSRKTLARLSVTIITKKANMQLNALSHLKQKTSISLNNLRVGDWCE